MALTSPACIESLELLKLSGSNTDRLILEYYLSCGVSSVKILGDYSVIRSYYRSFFTNLHLLSTVIRNLHTSHSSIKLTL